MKKITYDELVEHLKNTSPVFEDQDATRQTTMEKIVFMSHNKKKITWMRTLGRISGAAAFLLTCLLIQELIYLFPAPTEDINHLTGIPTQAVHKDNRGEIIRENPSLIIKDKLENMARKKQIYISLNIK